MTRHDPAVDGPLEQTADGVLLHVLAFPKARRNEIAGIRNGRLMVKVTAPPEDGKANDAIVKLLAKTLELAPASVELRNGATSREKTLLLNGALAEGLRAALNL